MTEPQAVVFVIDEDASTRETPQQLDSLGQIAG